MRMWRVSIAGLMGLVLVVAVGLAGLKEGTFWWAWASVARTVLAVLIAGLNAMFRDRRARPFWAGFALFGGAYVLLNLGTLTSPTAANLPLPTAWLLEKLHPRIHTIAETEDLTVQGWQAGSTSQNVVIWQQGSTFYQQPSLKVFRAQANLQPKPGSAPWKGSMEYYNQVGHALAALVFAAIGALGARFAYARREEPSEGPGEA